METWMTPSLARNKSRRPSLEVYKQEPVTDITDMYMRDSLINLYIHDLIMSYHDIGFWTGAMARHRGDSLN